MAFLVDSLLSDSISTLTKLVISVAQTAANFKPELKLLTDTLRRITPIIQDIVNMNRGLNRTEEECKMFKGEIDEAEKLVRRCSKVKRNIIKKFTYSLKLKDFNGKLLRFFQIEVQVIQTRGITETLSGVNDLKVKIDIIASDMRDMRLSKSRNGNYSGSMPKSLRTKQSGFENMEREKYGWRVPTLPNGIVAFDEPLAKLKAEVVADIDSNSMDCDDRSVLVVSGNGGCGKTTLVKMLCHDPGIQEKFGENIFFLTVSETPNFMVIVNDLFNPNSSSPQVHFQSNEDAKNKLEIFLNQKVLGPMLLVLDDVWSESFIDNFPSKNSGCKILVTSRTAFTNYDVLKFDPLNKKDAKTLFCRSAFTKGGKRPSPIINENLVNQKVGPWGSSGGDYPYEFIPNGRITKIRIKTGGQGGCIDSITFAYIDENSGQEYWSKTYGGPNGHLSQYMYMEAGEELTELSGSVGEYGGWTVVTSLCFKTNKQRREFGSVSDKKFSVPMKTNTAKDCRVPWAVRGLS